MSLLEKKNVNLIVKHNKKTVNINVKYDVVKKMPFITTNKNKKKYNSTLQNISFSQSKTILVKSEPVYNILPRGKYIITPFEKNKNELNNNVNKNYVIMIDVNKLFKQVPFIKNSIFRKINSPPQSNKIFLYNLIPNNDPLKNITYHTKLKMYDKVKKKYNIKIPKNIFRTFKTEYNEELKLSWVNTHPDFKYYFYDNAKCLEMIKENFSKEIYDTYATMKPGACKSDLWRCCVLYLYGGMYSDIDNKCLKNLEHVLDDKDFIIPIDSCESKSYFFNAFISSTARNNILYHHINRIVNNVKNKLYSNDIFNIAGPKAFGTSISNCLNKVIATEYEPMDLTAKINKYIKYDVQFNNNIYFLPNNTSSTIDYNTFFDSGYTYSTEGDCLKLNNMSDDKINYLHIGVNNESSFTIMESFYFGTYNYSVSPSNKNTKIINICHNEYEKIKNNITSLEIDFPVNVKDGHLIGNTFIFNVVKYDQTTITIMLIKTNNNYGWSNEFNISIYYKSLILDTKNINITESKIIVYDNLDYLKSQCTTINNIFATNKYSVKTISDTKIEVFIDSYNFYLPEKTIISYNVNNALFPQKQSIKFLYHGGAHECIYVDGHKIIKSQVKQNEKNNISSHYCVMEAYNDGIIYSSEEKKKIACVCCNIEFHKYINILLTSDLDIDYFIRFESEWSKYLKKQYSVKFKQIDLFDYFEYDKIIYFNFEDIENWYASPDKLIILNTFYENISEYNKYQIIDSHRFNSTKYNYILPVLQFLNINEKNEILKNEDTINIFFYDVLNDYYLLQLAEISINVTIYTTIIHNVDLRNENINIIYVSKDDNILSILSKCHYYVTLNDTVHQDLLFEALGFGCQIIMTKYKAISFNIKSALIFGESSINLKKNINLNNIFNDIANNIQYNKEIISYVINECQKDLF